MTSRFWTFDLCIQLTMCGRCCIYFGLIDWHSSSLTVLSYRWTKTGAQAWTKGDNNQIWFWLIFFNMLKQLISKNLHWHDWLCQRKSKLTNSATEHNHECLFHNMIMKNIPYTGTEWYVLWGHRATGLALWWGNGPKCIS